MKGKNHKADLDRVASLIPFSLPSCSVSRLAGSPITLRRDAQFVSASVAIASTLQSSVAVDLQNSRTAVAISSGSKCWNSEGSPQGGMGAGSGFAIQT